MWGWRHNRVNGSEQMSAAAAAKSLQSCPTLRDPVDAAHPAHPSLGFSRQEHWNWLPLPSPMSESEKWKWSLSGISDPQRPQGLQPTRLLHPWDFPGKSTGVGCHCLLQNMMLTVWISFLSISTSLFIPVMTQFRTIYFVFTMYIFVSLMPHNFAWIPDIVNFTFIVCWIILALFWDSSLIQKE